MAEDSFGQGNLVLKEFRSGEKSNWILSNQISLSVVYRLSGAIGRRVASRGIRTRRSLGRDIICSRVELNREKAEDLLAK